MTNGLNGIAQNLKEFLDCFTVLIHTAKSLGVVFVDEVVLNGILQVFYPLPIGFYQEKFGTPPVEDINRKFQGRCVYK